MQEFLSRENVARGTLLFVLCTFAGLFLSFLWGGTQDIKQVFHEMQVEMLLGAVSVYVHRLAVRCTPLPYFYSKSQTGHQIP